MDRYWIDAERSMKEGRSYEGVNLSDPDGKWVYYSPMSWHPDIAPSAPVSACRTPDKEAIPYALPVSYAKRQETPKLPVKIKGEGGGAVTNSCMAADTYETLYEHYSEDGRTFYDGWIRVKAPANMFMPGETAIQSDIRVTGEHKGRMKLRIVLQSDERMQVYPDRSLDEDGEP